nr:hypothetical protein [Pseudoalteromonas sp.]
MDDFLLNPYVSLYIGAFVQWSFLMAFLYSLVTSINNPKKEALWLSLIMSISYSSSMFIDIQNISYIQLFFSDLITFLAILIVSNFLTKNIFSTYLLLGLSINSLLFFCMHLDVSVFNNSTPWWFWSFYSLGINLIDFIMILVLFINKDFLGLVRLKKAFFQ